ncbi:2-oxo-4-hydroxy-4-carboxy-5-ureidoimidazoline decarboxylase [Pantoea latae]|uniref:2-oxo-4-hydroxy-4-carboxy-5-ureidoimidazoline decarboxylase n=1 Tax=Pantoea latae TaxID=1964541 RepID=A0A1V9DBM1_9GAMM|nr:2-oxo-4-hydroxy-4-carboxy-5-ureidoimidazoline decarboxylase [Pantoea latae]OQP31168.1 OHCU decarboxylase [Pantoea latae]
MNLASFNALPTSAAQAAIAHCVAIPRWQQALAAARPFASLAALLAEAERLTQAWSRDDLEQALLAHPRIGERASGAEKEAALSRQEQSAMGDADAALKQAMRAGNQAYEARFGRVFLIRASGRSGEEMLAQLQRRLTHDEPTETREALQQLREITLLRLKESLL